MNPLHRILEGESTTNPDQGTLTRVTSRAQRATFACHDPLLQFLCNKWGAKKREQWGTVYWCLVRVPRKPHLGARLNFSLLSPCKYWASTNSIGTLLFFSVLRSPSAPIACTQGSESPQCAFWTESWKLHETCITSIREGVPGLHREPPQASSPNSVTYFQWENTSIGIAQLMSLLHLGRPSQNAIRA